MFSRVVFLLTILIGFAAPSFAHEVRPGFVQIQEIEPSVYDILWKTPAQGDMRLNLHLILPENCTTVGQVRSTKVDGALIQRWRSKCESGLPGKVIEIENLKTSLTDVIFRYQPLSGTSKTQRISGADAQATVPTQLTASGLASTYIRLGVEHILLGFDHLLFLLCLIILVNNLRRLLGVVTAFTVAHSITLASATLGWIRVPIAPVEACIAFSILILAAEIIWVRRGRPGLAQRFPWIATFGFGLLHGLGFASALNNIGLPGGAVPQALLFFNIGVEVGQILIVLGILIAIFLIRKLIRNRLPEWSHLLLPNLIGIIAAYWFIERTAQILF